MVKQRRFSLLLLNLSVRLIIYRSFAVFICIILLSGLLGTIPEHMSLSVAQQTVNTEQDKISISAKQVFDEGLKFYEQGTAKSIVQAIDKWQEALLLWRKIDDNRQSAATLLYIGRAYDDLGDKHKALSYYNQALPLFQVVKDKTAEGITLNNIATIYDELGQKQTSLEFYNQALSIRRATNDKIGQATTLSNIGLIYSDLNQLQKALEFLNESLVLFHTQSDKAGEGRTLNNLGLVYFKLGENQKSLESFNKSLPLLHAVGAKAEEAVTYSNVGDVYVKLGENEKALEFYERALSIKKDIDDKQGQARSLNNIAKVYEDLRNQSKALQLYNQSLQIFRNEKDKLGESIVLGNIAGLYSNSGEKQKALSLFNQALLLARAEDYKAEEASILNNMGSVYNELGDKLKAIDFFNKSLLLSRAAEDIEQEGITLNSIGGVYSDFGENKKALEFYEQSLFIRRKINDKLGESKVINNIGKVYDDLGDKQKALELYKQSLELTRTLNDKNGEATTLNNIGSIYQDLNEKQQALKFYNQSLPIFRTLSDNVGEALTLSNIGLIYNDLNQPLKAHLFLDKSLKLSRAANDKMGEARTLNNIGGYYSNSGNKQLAINFYKQSLKIHVDLGNKDGQANSLNNLASAYSDLGNTQLSQTLFNQSLQISREIDDKMQQIVTLGNMGYVERNNGNLIASAKYIQEAIEVIESLRTNYTSQELRTSYFSSRKGYYDFYIDLLMQLHQKDSLKGYDAQALHYSERSRARNLLELLAEAKVDIRKDVDSKLLQRERELQQQLTAAESRRLQLLKGQRNDKQLESVKQNVEILNSQLDEVQAQIRVLSPEYALLTQTKEFSKLTLKLTEIQKQVLDDNTLLLQYSLGEERSYVWVVSNTSIKAYPLPKGALLEAAIEEFNKELLTKEYSDISSKLSEIILAPIIQELGQKRLLIVADGKLQTVPFATLPLPGNRQITPLVLNHEVVSLPSTSTISILRNKFKGRKLAPKTVAVLADPVFEPDDERLTVQTQNNFSNKQAPTNALRSCNSLPRLEYTETEAQDILSSVPASQRLKAVGFDASRATATSPELAKYQIVHFATHGCINEDYPQLSGVALSQFDKKGAEEEKGMLYLQDIYNLNLPVELVTLSACKTGLGKDIKGEGIIGLTRGFMYAGAKRVVVSLWSVNDSQTADFMNSFYQRILKKKLNPVAALRETQLQMWKQKKAPLYWGAFIVQGEWR